MAKSSIGAICILFPLVCGLYYLCLKRLLKTKSLVPTYVSNIQCGGDLQKALICCGLSLIPYISIELYLLLSTRTKLTKNVKQNTIEQTFLFFIGMLGASTYSAIDFDQMLILTTLHILSRFLYWAMYILSDVTKTRSIRTIAFFLTFVGNFHLIELTFYRTFPNFSSIIRIF